MRVDITLGLIAGAAQMLEEDDRFAMFYFQGLHDITIDALKKWPKYPATPKQARRYVNRLDKALRTAQEHLQPLLHDLPSFLNFLLAEVTDLQGDLGNSPRAPLLNPIVDMLEQYIDTVQGYQTKTVDHGLVLSDTWKAAIK